MDKFGMSFGTGPSRKDLLDTIESQKKQLVQYQTRFKDVVRAYKSLLKEKEALEASLKVLTVTQDVDLDRQEATAGPVLLEDGCSLHSEDSEDTTASVDAASEDTRDEEDQGEPGQRSSSTADLEAGLQQAPPPGGAEAERRLAQLRAQLSTLTASLTTVAQEKSRMEASFQADRRQAKQEAEEVQERLAAAAAQQEAELGALRQQLAESRARVITQQHERQQEQGDHGQQLRELQRLLQQERDLRQEAELRLHDASHALLASSQALDREAESETHLRQAREEREELRRRLQLLQEEQQRADPRVEELQEELQELKASFQLQLLTESRRASEEEERTRERARAAEQRGAGLEERVSELSDLLGSCQKARLRDQEALQRLRDRVLQLDLENKTLAASGRSGSEEAQLDVAALTEKLRGVKKLLRAARRNQNLLDPADPEEEPGQELRLLQEEFERYKLRAQLLLKDASCKELEEARAQQLKDASSCKELEEARAQQLKDASSCKELEEARALLLKDASSCKELEEARAQLAELRQKYIDLRLTSDEAEERRRRQLEERQRQVAAQLLAHRQELERAEAQHRDQLLRLEAELHKQRERTLKLLEEKDQELERLRGAALRSADEADGAREAGSDCEGDAVGQALRQATPTESTLLLYAEQLARKEVEVGVLRRHRNRLEEELHQLQAKLLANAERHEEETAELQGRLLKLSRDQSREGANMEYLKNVVFRFLTLQDASGRRQTLNAIIAILHFSPQEKQEVTRLQGPGWWGPGRR